MERRRTDECVVDRLRAEARPTTKELERSPKRLDLLVDLKVYRGDAGPPAAEPSCRGMVLSQLPMERTTR